MPCLYTTYSTIQYYKTNTDYSTTRNAWDLTMSFSSLASTLVNLHNSELNTLFSWNRAYGLNKNFAMKKSSMRFIVYKTEENTTHDQLLKGPFRVTCSDKNAAAGADYPNFTNHWLSLRNQWPMISGLLNNLDTFIHYLESKSFSQQVIAEMCVQILLTCTSSERRPDW